MALGQRSQALLTMLYRSTDRLCRCGAPMKNLAHSASFESLEKNAPSKPGTKQLALQATILDRGAGGRGERYEPLVLPWSSHNNTVLAPDQGFLMTYGLVPRVIIDGTVIWDDLTGPVRDVVRVTRPSVYDFPRSTSASVSISKRFLRDYLSLRQMALVQSFWKQRWSPPDEELEERWTWTAPLAACGFSDRQGSPER